MTGRGKRADGETQALCYMKGSNTEYEIPGYVTTQGTCAKVDAVNLLKRILLTPLELTVILLFLIQNQ
jgi:hypothetical protein